MKTQRTRFSKRVSAILTAALLSLTIAACVGLAACGQETANAPQPEEVVAAIQKNAEEKIQDYKFTLSLAGNVSVGPISSQNADATYSCSYYCNEDTGEMRFKRTTSGMLLFDATEYIYSQGDSRVKVKMNDQNAVKWVSVTQGNDDELALINLPFRRLIESWAASNIDSVKANRAGSSAYPYHAKIKLLTGDGKLNALLSILGKIGSTISFKGVTVSNPEDIGFDFSLSDGDLDGFEMSAELSVPVKAASVKLQLKYKEEKNTSIILPTLSGLITDPAEIRSTVQKVNGALQAVKDDPCYALDLEAVNEMDPSMTTLATKDTFESRLFKNTSGSRVDFNNSYEYHSHHEEQGRETYKYTLGNITDGSTHLVSRKGTNKVAPESGASADKQFDFLTKNFILAENAVDCIRTSTSNGQTVYSFYLKDSAVVDKSKAIVEILNSNPADGVVTVDNAFNDADFTVQDAELTVVMNGNDIVSIELATRICYNPTSGDYTENNVTLDNVLRLTVNDADLLAKAGEYVAPEKDDALFGKCLKDASFYIL